MLIDARVSLVFKAILGWTVASGVRSGGCVSIGCNPGGPKVQRSCHYCGVTSNKELTRHGTTQQQLSWVARGQTLGRC
ncbi:hypothetical protein BST61_g4257 [Cercospora zeina]